MLAADQGGVKEVIPRLAGLVTRVTQVLRPVAF